MLLILTVVVVVEKTMRLLPQIEICLLMALCSLTSIVTFRYNTRITAYTYTTSTSTYKTLITSKVISSPLLSLYSLKNSNSNDGINNTTNTDDGEDSNNDDDDDDDDDDNISVDIAAFKQRQDELRKQNSDAAYEDQETNILGVNENTRYFREYASRGLEKFKKGDLDGSIQDLRKARDADSRQPLMQLGIFLYINGNYEDAEKQLMKDIITIENARINKASELRIWRSASLSKLGNTREAKQILNEPVTKNFTAMNEDRYIMNITMGLFNGDIGLESIMQLIESSEERDASGFRFYGNLYTALYFDSIGDADLCKTFLGFAIATNPSTSRDIWYHLPRLYYIKRYGVDDLVT